MERGDIVEQLRLSGRVAAVRQEDLGFTKAGRVLRVHVRAGDKVRKGQLLAELGQREELDALAKAQVALEQAQIVLRRGEESQKFAIARAKLDLQEAQTILDQAKTESERELARIGVQRAQLGLEEAQAVTNEEAEKQVAAARIEFNRLKEQVETGKLRATFAGDVGDVAAQPGTNVEPFAPVVS
ncbi:MAG: biotin/lipoyl-binding protein, partial [Chloroflexota bacterium]|nr:biotin/lipoyl-binding protein [Chloroflexota bacterium]